MHGHHVRHWTRGGETDLRNLVELCTFHHRLVHEGGWRMTFDGVDRVTFLSPDGRQVGERPNRASRGGSAESHRSG